MKPITPTLFGIALLVVGLMGCAKVPQAELDGAQAALQAAADAGADAYVADLYQAAQDSFAAAQVEIETQNAASSFSRDYDRAAALLAFVAETAAQAEAQVAERKEVLRGETQTLIAQAREAVAQTETLLAQAPRGKDGAVALVSIHEDAAAAGTTLQEAQAALEADDVARAHALAQTALDQATALNEELSAAIAKTGAPRS